MTGKSSLVSIISFALYNKISNNVSKKSSIIHIGKTNAFVQLIILQFTLNNLPKSERFFHFGLRL